MPTNLKRVSESTLYLISSIIFLTQSVNICLALILNSGTISSNNLFHQEISLLKHHASSLNATTPIILLYLQVQDHGGDVSWTLVRMFKTTAHLYLITLNPFKIYYFLLLYISFAFISHFVLYGFNKNLPNLFTFLHKSWYYLVLY